MNDSADSPAKETKSAFRFRYVLFALVLCLFYLALFSHDPADMAVLDGGSRETIQNLVGPTGAQISRFLLMNFGIAVYPLVFFLTFCLIRAIFLNAPRRQGNLLAILSVCFGTVLLLSLWPGSFLPLTARLGIGSESIPEFALSGGLFGQFFGAPEGAYSPAGLIRRYIGLTGSLVTSLAFLLSGLVWMIVTDWKRVISPLLGFRFSVSRVPQERFPHSGKENSPVPPAGEKTPSAAPSADVKAGAEPPVSGQAEKPEELRKEPVRIEPSEENPFSGEPEEPASPDPEEPEEEKEDHKQTHSEIINGKIGSKNKSPITTGLAADNSSSGSGTLAHVDYMLPPVGLFDVPKEVVSEDTSHLEDSKTRLQGTLDSFHIAGQVVRTIVGPRVTRFEIQLEPGVKVSLVTGIENNIAMDMMAQSIRILAPVPGENTVGVEVPNKTSSIVYIRSLLETDEWKGMKGNASSIPIILGRDVAGRAVIANLAKAPHLLIAGSTGSGKSVCMNTLIMSLLSKFSPFDLRLILVDPKHVELAMYQPLPHLITPVINDPKQVPLALRWADNEMERRYRLLASVKAKNLQTFNSRPKPETPELDEAGNPIPERLPLLIIIVDELADIMMTDAKKDVETFICRIAQKGRAAGIHLVIATQTPRKDIITGVIKANLPTKIAFRVTSGIDSRVILDCVGAENLLGWGDMLFLAPGGEGLERVQGTMVSDSEIQKVVDFVAPQVPQQFDSDVVTETEVVDGTGAGNDSKPDPLMDDDEHDESLSAITDGQAREVARKYLRPGDNDLIRRSLEIVLQERRVSTSYLQRRLGIGYNKSAEIIDELEKRGVVSPPLPGGQKRDILILDELLDTNNNV